MELSFLSRLIESRSSGPGCQSTSALAPEVLLRLLYCVPSSQLRNKANAFQKESLLFSSLSWEARGMMLGLKEVIQQASGSARVG